MHADCIQISLEVFGDAMEILEPVDLVPTEEELAVAVQEMRDAFRSASAIYYLQIFSIPATVMTHVSIIVGSWNQVTCIDLLIYDRPDDQSLPAVTSFIGGYVMLERIEVIGLSTNILAAVCSAVASLPSVKTCILTQDYIYDPIHVYHDQALLLRRVLENPSIKDMKLHGIELADDKATDVFCRGLESTAVKKLDMGYILFSTTTAVVAYAQALARSNIFQLKCRNSDRLFWKSFGKAISESGASTSLRKIDLSGDDVETFLKESKHCKLSQLRLSVNKWTEPFDKALADFVKENESVRKLTLHYCSFTGVGSFASKTVLEALDEGTRSLEELVFDPREKFDPIWRGQVDHILALNLHRRILDPLFATFSRDETEFVRQMRMVFVMKSLDRNLLDEFMRRNEWNLQSLLKRRREESEEGEREEDEW